MKFSTLERRQIEVVVSVRNGTTFYKRKVVKVDSVNSVYQIVSREIVNTDFDTMMKDFKELKLNK